jgi:hypothetical protein
LRGRLDERLPVEGFRLQVASRYPVFHYALTREQILTAVRYAGGQVFFLVIRPELAYKPPALRLKGARMPSIAEDVATDLTTVRSRIAEFRRYRLAAESFAPMRPW